MSKVFDLDMIKAVYSRFPERIAAARQVVNKPLTLTEKILYAHLWEGAAKEAYSRGGSYVDFAPDRVPCKMPLRKWLCCNLCRQVASKWPCRAQCTAIT